MTLNFTLEEFPTSGMFYLMISEWQDEYTCTYKVSEALIYSNTQTGEKKETLDRL